MKKITLFIIISLLIFSMGACTNPVNSENTETQTPQQQFEVPTGAFNERDMIFVYNGIPYPISSDSALLLEALGEQYEEMASPSCAFVGEDKKFIYDNITVYTYPDGEKDLINEIYFYGGNYTTSRGISLGNSLEQVKSVYGEGGFEQGNNYIYVVSGSIEDTMSPKLYFELTDGIVSGISFFGANGVIQ